MRPPAGRRKAARSRLARFAGERRRRRRARADLVRQRVPPHLDTGAAAGMVMPIFAMRPLGVVAQIDIGGPGLFRGRRGIGARQRRIAAVSELDLVAWAAEGTGNEQHCPAPQCAPGTGPAPRSSMTWPEAKRSSEKASLSGCGASLAIVWAKTHPEPGVAL